VGFEAKRPVRWPPVDGDMVAVAGGRCTAKYWRDRPLGQVEVDVRTGVETGARDSSTPSSHEVAIPARRPSRPLDTRAS